MPDRTRILLVEDNPDDARLFWRSVLDAGEHDVVPVHVETLGEAVERVAEGDISLILLDLSLPDSQGLDTVLRMIEGAPDVPVVVLTGLDDADTGQQAITAGAQDYLVKGHVDGRLLGHCLRYAAARHALMRKQVRLVEELEESNRAKTYFAATMSHELRNTLTVVAGYADMLASEWKDGGGRVGNVLASIRTRADESLQVIQTTLELTRSESIAGEPEWSEVALSELFAELVDETQLPSNKRDLRLTSSVEPGAEQPLRTDATKLRMVLRNLLTNAVKFAEHGMILLSAERTDDGVRIRVKDPGRGIPEDQLPALFEPFRQAHGFASRGAGGVGLGLYIVQRVVRLLGGSIAVASKEGEGSTFTLRLPIEPPDGDS